MYTQQRYRPIVNLYFAQKRYSGLRNKGTVHNATKVHRDVKMYFAQQKYNWLSPVQLSLMGTEALGSKVIVEEDDLVITASQLAEVKVVIKLKGGMVKEPDHTVPLQAAHLLADEPDDVAKVLQRGEGMKIILTCFPV